MFHAFRLEIKSDYERETNFLEQCNYFIYQIEDLHKTNSIIENLYY